MSSTSRWTAVVIPDFDDAPHQRTYEEPLATAGAKVKRYYPKSSGQYDKSVQELAAKVDKARKSHPERPVIVVGMGIGGSLALRYAQLFPNPAVMLALVNPILGNVPLLSENEGSELNTLDLSRTDLRALDKFLLDIAFDHPLGDDVRAVWIHGGRDQLAPLADVRAGMDQVRGLGFRELIFPDGPHNLLYAPQLYEAVQAISKLVEPVPPS
jgi:pimeloyl-ACP methyl ester carboxylesterase